MACTVLPEDTRTASPRGEVHGLDRCGDGLGEVDAEGRRVRHGREVHGLQTEHDPQPLGQDGGLVLERVDDLDPDEPGAAGLGHQAADGRAGDAQAGGDLVLRRVLEVVHPGRLVHRVEREPGAGTVAGGDTALRRRTAGGCGVGRTRSGHRARASRGGAVGRVPGRHRDRSAARPTGW
ncbi:hypothetical protein DEJ15_14705 [Curtobacterium sp. MCJR17_043]|nr:hypothetical protein [Curtobacterium sp. MCJR17_043]WIB35466.1 hypothetical protein DEJ15_14705 [Curtobacterium sp. MCJR17_043]